MSTTDRDAPHVAVVIPVRNGAADLARCLASLSRQDYPRDRTSCIVVDNGSTDDSAAIAARAGATVLRFPELRVGALRNRGVEQSTGEVLAFVDADHEVPADWIRQGVHSLHLRGPRVIVGAHYHAPANGTWVQKTWELHRLRHQDRQREVAWLGTGNLFIRRKDFLTVGGFREDLIATEDVDLCTRFVQAGGKVLLVPDIQNVHYGEPKTLWAFLQKEYGRGKTGLRGFLRNGMPLEEWPSISYALFHLVALILLAASMIGAIVYWVLWPLPVALGILVAPSLLMAARTCGNANIVNIPRLTLLYLLYGIARAGSLFRW